MTPTMHHAAALCASRTSRSVGFMIVSSRSARGLCPGERQLGRDRSWQFGRSTSELLIDAPQVGLNPLADDATLLRVHQRNHVPGNAATGWRHAEKGPGVGGFSAGTNRQCVAALNHVLGAERDTEDVIDDSADKTSAAGAGGGLPSALDRRITYLLR